MANLLPSQPNPALPPVSRVTVELTWQEAALIGYIAGQVGGSYHSWQRVAFSSLYETLSRGLAPKQCGDSMFADSTQVYEVLSKAFLSRCSITVTDVPNLEQELVAALHKFNNEC